MDYSAVSSDADALHGASPWGSSSPRADRAFPGSTADSPGSPAPLRGHSYNHSQDSISDTPYLTQPSETVPTSSTDSPQPHHSSDEPQQTQPVPDDQAPGSNQQYTAQGQQRPGAARYHSAKQQRPVPQYKLQAKVTALERTGRKDPVIRFDVYVWLFFHT